MKQFLAAVLVAVCVLPSFASGSWVWVDSRFFEGFRYNESTDEWLRDDGEYYESSGELFDCYGFYYDYGCDVWYNEDGFIDEDFCVRYHSDGGFFYCDSCENLMFSSESDDPDCHTGDCLDPDDFGIEENCYHTYDSSDSYDPPDTNEPEEGTDIEKDEKYSFIRILGLIVLLFFAGWPIVAFFVTFVCAAIGAFRRT